MLKPNVSCMFDMYKQKQKSTPVQSLFCSGGGISLINYKIQKRIFIL